MTPPKIFTGSWSTCLPDTHLKIGVSRGVPRGTPAGYRRYPALNPGSWFRSVAAGEFHRLYHDEVLKKLDAERVVRDLTAISAGRIPVLTCFEKSAPGDDWCHRGIISVWLNDKVGLEVPEYGQEKYGCGHCHPKLPRELRVKTSA